ncbi:FadR/GntR family transcriptional regulator [Membranihabitans maritimus]|uniref:FadR/GntR family transcriptional regulator n=1 Tax=Membranihabitans maritimus TaxID=2904244 RepID=UPI001F031069|nr:GntR family transcriptional regulator [Membranihabitans maritimus]
MEEELRSITLVDQLEHKLLKYIKEADLREGDSLPSESFFSEKYNVSRNLVRESLSRLKMLNIIESRRRRGMVIKEADPMVNFVKVIRSNLIGKQSMLDLIELRCAIEIGITPMIFKSVDHNDILELEEIVDRENKLGDVKVSVEDEINFHTRIYQIVDNSSLLTLQNVLIPIFSYAHSNFLDFNNYVQRLRDEGRIVSHNDLVDFIKEGDESGYKEGIERHLRAFLDYVYEFKKEK